MDENTILKYEDESKFLLLLIVMVNSAPFNKK